jgi:uncharacterized membrane protein
MENMFAKRRKLLNLSLSFLGIGIVIFYTVCDQSCAYLKGSILSLDLKYLGILFMGLVFFLTYSKRPSLLLLYLSAGVGVEIYLIGFQVKTGVYCPYCMAFGVTVFSLFFVNFDSSKKIPAILMAIFSLVVFSFLFQGSVIPQYG